VAELPDVHADDRHRGGVHRPHRVEHGAVAADRDYEIETCREGAGIAAVVTEVARGRTIVGDAYLDAVLDEPGRRRPGKGERRRSLAVRDQADDARRAHVAAVVCCPRATVASTAVVVTVADPRVAYARNSTLPSAPRRGE